MIVRVNSDLETGGTHAADDRLVPPPNVRRRQQGSVQKRPHPVKLHDIGPADLPEKAWPQNAPDRLAGVIGSQ